jgi:hypothetical protein
LTGRAAGIPWSVSATGIDWGGAVVEDATLKVGLTARPTRAWAQRFRMVLALLDRSSGEWDAISLRADAITVTNLREGSEEKLRHMLESIVTEVQGGHVEDTGPRDEEREKLRASDRRMTDAFRRPKAAE